MKTKLLLLLLAFSLMSSTCSEDEPIVNDCNCEIEYYLYVPTVGGGGGTYQFIDKEPINFDCINEDFGHYFNVSNVNYNYAKIVCE
jgi:hypothetical protein